MLQKGQTIFYLKIFLQIQTRNSVGSLITFVYVTTAQAATKALASPPIFFRFLFFCDNKILFYPMNKIFEFGFVSKK